MTDLLPKLRADFELVGKHCLESGEWSKDDFKEFGAAIKTVADQKDNAMLVLWARDMAIRANAVLYQVMVCRSIDEQMRARVAKGEAAK